MAANISFNQTPLFQLNLMLWLVWPSSDVAGIRPVFREEGFHLHTIGPFLPTPLQTQALLADQNITVRTGARPELMLRHNDKQYLVPIECKTNSFSPDSDNSQQAVALLTITGAGLAQRIGLPSPSQWQAHLYYAVKDDQQSAMADTLQEISSRLQNLSIDVIQSSVIGIAVSNDGVYLQAVPPGVGPVEAFSNAKDSWIKVAELKEGDDPNPLYLIPIDPNIEIDDPVGQAVVRERLRSAVASILISQLYLTKFDVDENDIMRCAIEVWDYWGDEAAKSGLLSRIVRPYLRRVVGELQEFGITVTMAQRRISCSNITLESAEKIRRYLMSRTFLQGKIGSSGNQMAFDDISEIWQ